MGTSKGKGGPPGEGTYLATRGSGETPVLEAGEGFLPAGALRACSESRPLPWLSAPQLEIHAGSAECFRLGRRELSRKGETAGGLKGWIHGWEAGQRLQAHLPASQALHRPLSAQPGSAGPPACVESCRSRDGRQQKRMVYAPLLRQGFRGWQNKPRSSHGPKSLQQEGGDRWASKQSLTELS